MRGNRTKRKVKESEEGTNASKAERGTKPTVSIKNVFLFRSFSVVVVVVVVVVEVVVVVQRLPTRCGSSTVPSLSFSFCVVCFRILSLLLLNFPSHTTSIAILANPRTNEASHSCTEKQTTTRNHTPIHSPNNNQESLPPPPSSPSNPPPLSPPPTPPPPPPLISPPSFPLPPYCAFVFPFGAPAAPFPPKMNLFTANSQNKYR